MERIKEFLAALRSKLFDKYEWKVDFTEWIPKYDIQSARISSALGYIFFLIPLLINEDRQFARFHCNQSLLNLILSTVVVICWGMIPGIGIYLMMLQMLVCVVIGIRGMVLALQGKAVGIPLVGWITLVAYRLPGQ